MVWSMICLAPILLYWNGQLGWTPALGTLFVREDVCPRHVERRVT